MVPTSLEEVSVDRELEVLQPRQYASSVVDADEGLHTADARGLYAKLGFGEGPPPYPLMERPAAASRPPSQ